jgi:hypothetical protein
MALEDWCSDVEDAGPYPLPNYVPFAAALIAGSVAMLTGRCRTRLDNFFLGGLLAGFAAFRDPRPTIAQTLIVASVEGAIAGAADRVIPLVKEAILPDAEPASDAALTPAVA